MRLLLPFLLPLSLTVSALAFDQYGQLSEQLEQESAMRERAETLATQVWVFTLCIQLPQHVHNEGCGVLSMGLSKIT